MPYADVIEAPPGCEIALRGGADRAYYFALNYERKPAVLRLKKELTDLYTGKSCSGAVELPPYGTAVFEE
jgi:beta-galactosidase GanA